MRNFLAGNLPRQTTTGCCLLQSRIGNIEVIPVLSYAIFHNLVELTVKKLHRSQTLILGVNRAPACCISALDGNSLVRQKQNPALRWMLPRRHVHTPACRSNPNGMSHRVNRNVDKLIKRPASLNATACDLDVRLHIPETVCHLISAKRAIFDALGFYQSMLAQKIIEPLVAL